MKTLHRKTVDGATNTTTNVSLKFTADDTLDQYIADFNIEVSGNSAAVTVKGKGSFPNSTMLPVTDGTAAIGGGHFSISSMALSSLDFTTTGSAYKIMLTRTVDL